MIKRYFPIATVLSLALLAASPASARAAVSDDQIKMLTERIQSLENDLAVLKRQKEVDEEKSDAAAQKTPSVDFGKKGLKITSADKNYEISVKGYAQLDYHNFLRDTGNTGRNEFIARRIRPVIEGRAGNASFRVMPDFAGTTTIYDAYAEYKIGAPLQFRVGKFKPPVGLERLQSASDTMFIERGLPTNLVPNRDFGFQLGGNLASGALEYQLGVFNGTTDLGNTNNDSDDKKDFAARVFAQPFQNADTVALRGLGLGVGGTTGDRAGSPKTPILGDYRTPGQQSFFTYLSNTAPTIANTVFASGRQWRLSPQAYWYYNSLGLLAEYVLSDQTVTKNSISQKLQNKAWQVEGSYLLTGEDAAFKGGVQPAHDFGPGGDGWGAWEIVGRVGVIDIDNDAFPLYANPAASASKATSYGGGLNWYLNYNMKLAVNYDFTMFDGGAAGGQDRKDEQALFSRAQFRF